jgi:hypothetical protein
MLKRMYFSAAAGLAALCLTSAPADVAAWEREFDGRARASVNGYALDAPSLRGNTGVAELGLSVRPSQALPLFVDVGAQGYAGKREGVTGTLQARFEF